MRSKEIILIACLFFSVGASADLDLKVSAALRTYPLGGGLSLESGYGLLLWGDSGGAENPWYGYLRPFIDIESSGTYNAAGAGLELFPISFLGARSGVEKIRSDKEYSAHKCDLYTCTGDFEKAYAEGHLLLGLGPVFLAGIATREWWKSSKTIQKDFIDPVSSLALNKDGDMLDSLKAIAGYKISPEWSVLYSGYFCKNQLESLSTRMNILSLAWGIESWSIVLGAGSFESGLQKEGFTAIGRIQWKPLPSVGLL